MEHSRQEESLFPSLSASPAEEAAIKQRADRVGKQIGDAVSSLLAEIMLSILATRSQTVHQTPTRISHHTSSPIASSISDGILTAEEVAQILKISKAKAYCMIQRGEIHAIQFDRTRSVRRQDLEEFIAAHMK